MNLRIWNMGRQYELRRPEGKVGRVSSLAFQSVAHTQQFLRSVLGFEKDLHRIRRFGIDAFGWRDLSKCDDKTLIRNLARELYHGNLQMIPCTERAHPVKAPVPVGDSQEDAVAWVEPDPNPEPESVEPAAYAVSPEAAEAMAESNREMAESGTSLKQLCKVTQDCPVCNGQMAVMSA